MPVNIKPYNKLTAALSFLIDSSCSLEVDYQNLSHLSINFIEES